MNIKGLFEKVGAPLNNYMWSWGAVRNDGAVFLRVWQDRTAKIDGKLCMMVADRVRHGDETDNLGWNERLEHVELIENGAPCYMIMCQVEDAKAMPRIIKGFNRKDIFVGGKLIEKDGNQYVELSDRVPVKDVIGQR